MRRILTILLVAINVLNVWAYDYQKDGIYYNIISNLGVEVTSIGNSDNNAYQNLQSITIPEQVEINHKIYTVISIEAYCFADCYRLMQITLPTSIQLIGKNALKNCPAEIIIQQPYGVSPTITVAKEIIKDETEDVIVIVPPIEAPVEEEEEEVIFMVVETMPEFPGGAQAMRRYIDENLKYPIIAQENGIQGRVICQFVIEKDGKVTNIQVVRSSGEPSLDKEAVRVINSMPKWKPGKQRGTPVRVKYTIPVNFRL